MPSVGEQLGCKASRAEYIGASPGAEQPGYSQTQLSPPATSCEAADGLSHFNYPKGYFTRVRATSRTGAITSGTFSTFTEEVSRPKY